MQIIIDTAQPLTELDRAVLAVVTGGTVADTTRPGASTPAAAKAAPAAKKAAAKVSKKAEPEPEPEVDEDEETKAEDEDLVGGGPTMEEAVAKATKLVSSGQAAKVKAALAEVGAKRVSEVSEDDLATFVAALS